MQAAGFVFRWVCPSTSGSWGGGVIGDGECTMDCGPNFVFPTWPWVSRFGLWMHVLVVWMRRVDAFKSAQQCTRNNTPFLGPQGHRT